MSEGVCVCVYVCACVCVCVCVCVCGCCLRHMGKRFNVNLQATETKR